MQQTMPRQGRSGQPTPPASLDTPLQNLLTLNWETVAWVTLFVLAVITRLWDVGGRAMSHDESLHTLYAWQLYTGKGYEHNPMMHGPFRFHLNALFYFLFGVSDFVARLPAALFGIATVILIPLMLRRYLGRIGALVTSLLLLISPVILYHNRYIRDEVFVGFFALLMITGLFYWLDDRRPRWLYMTTAAMVLMFTTMEAAYIQDAIFGAFAVAAFLWSMFFMRERDTAGALLQRARENPLMGWIVTLGTLVLPLATAFIVKMTGANPQDYSAPGLTRSFIVYAVLALIGAAIGLWWGGRRWLVMAAIWYSIAILLFTTFFTNRNGIATGFLGSLGYWLEQHGVERGGQPEYYYAFLAPIYEFLPLWFSLAAIVYFVWKPGVMTARGGSDLSRALFVPFIMWWSLASFVGFSFAGERMPWLLYYIALPLCLLAGRFVGDVFERQAWGDIGRRGGWLFAALLVPALVVLVIWVFLRPFQGMALGDLRNTILWLGALAVLGALLWGLYSVGRRLGWHDALAVTFATLFGIMVVLTVRTSFFANYINDELATEFIVYAHASPDVKMVANELDQLSMALGGPREMKIVYDNLVPWPFEWYLRDYNNKQFVGENPPGPIDAPVVLIGSANDAKFRPYLRNDYVRREYNMIWWPMEDYKNQTLASVLALLQNPAERQKWFDILMWRKYPRPLSDWYHHNKFVLYVRKDAVNKIWALGAADASTMSAEAAQPSQLDKVIREVTAQQIFGAGQLASPKGVGVDDKGNLFVVDSNNNRIVKYGPQAGQPLKTWGGPGSGQGQFKDGPWGIAVDSRRGFVYVADTWNGRIQKFDLEGGFLAAWGNFDQAASLNDKPLALYGPRDIAVDGDGNLLVTDTGNKRIVKFSADGQPLAQYGGGGFEPGKFQEPVGIAVSPTDGSIYVADTWNRRVQKFDKAMNPLAQWNVEAWEGQSVVNKPYLAVDARNRVYLTDPEGFRVIVLDDKGQPVAVMGQPGKDAKGIELPIGIAVGADSKIFVADSNNGRVVQWPALP